MRSMTGYGEASGENARHGVTVSVWQMSQWGQDQLALERRAFRAAEFQAAVTVLKLAA
ncbi:MAG TPA: hypothetical protein VLV54_15245 [Thermoanaerobaculia bacterium]|nr:hypothetical protein [Thermoanaerobaculia bacterium]